MFILHFMLKPNCVLNTLTESELLLSSICVLYTVPLLGDREWHFHILIYVFLNIYVCVFCSMWIHSRLLFFLNIYPIPSMRAHRTAKHAHTPCHIFLRFAFKNKNKKTHTTHMANVHIDFYMCINVNFSWFGFVVFFFRRLLYVSSFCGQFIC